MKKLSITVLYIILSLQVQASSHHESPFSAINPAVDIADVYAFTSYESGREDFITIIANIIPEANPSGPFGYGIDTTALYEIKIDRNLDAREDLTFRFSFDQVLSNNNKGITLTVDDKTLSVPFANNASFPGDFLGTNQHELTYTLDLISNKTSFEFMPRANKLKKGKPIKHAADAFIPEIAPIDNKTFDHNQINSIKLPIKKCKTEGKVFAGIRANSFKANLDPIYDLANANLEQAENGASSNTADKTFSLALELPKDCLDIDDDDPILGIWATANLPARVIVKNNPSYHKPTAFSNESYIQVSRLAHPLVNQFIIGLQDKNLYNVKRPRKDKDSKFIKYFTNPTLPEIIETHTNLTAPNLFPRSDLTEFLLTGISGINQDSRARQTEILRLNTSTTAVAKGSQNRLGVLGGDNAGYPNGRRPGDDIVDIFLRVMIGARIDDAVQAPSKDTVLTDGVLVEDALFDEVFPYLVAP